MCARARAASSATRSAGGRLGREQPQRAAEQPRRGRRVARGRRLARLAQHRDGGGVAVTAGVLDVVGARRGRGAARGERGGAALVGAEAPAAGRGLVDRAAHERVPEAEAARHVRGADEVAAQQLVERVHRRGLGTPAAAAASSGSNGSPATAAPSRTRRAPADRTASSSASAAATARGTCTPASETSVAAASPRLAPRRARELLEVERVPAALRVERRGHGGADARAEQRARLVAAQRLELEAASACPARRARSSATASRSGTCRGRSATTIRTARVGRAAQQRAEQLERPGVRPVQVVEQQHERLRRRQRLQQPAEGAVRAVAIALRRRAGRRQRREHVRELGARLARRARRAGAARAPGRTRPGRRRRARTAARARAPTRCPPSTSQPRRSARAPSSASRRVLPMPGSPSSSSAAARPRSSSASDCSREPSSAARPTICSTATAIALSRASITAARARNQGLRSGSRPDVRDGRAAQQAPPMPCFLIHHRHEPHECGVVFASFRGPREPAAPPRDARLVPVRRARDLVDGAGRQRRRRARAPPLLRRPARHRNQGRRGRHPMTRKSRRARGGTVVLGGGFAGASVARRLGRRGATIVNPTNFMLYTPLLPEAAAGSIEPRHVVVPLRTMCPHAELLMGSAVGLDLERRVVEVDSEAGRFAIEYAELVVALGSVTRMPAVPGLREHALGLKDLTDAIRLRNHVLRQIELADAAPETAARRLTFVFAGAGFAGVEALAELQELAAGALRRHPRLAGVQPRWVLVDRAPRILGQMPAASRAPRRGRSPGAASRSPPRPRWPRSTRPARCSSDGRRIETATVVWTAGVAANPLAARLGLPVDERGRLRVDETLQVRRRAGGLGARRLRRRPERGDAGRARPGDLPARAAPGPPARAQPARRAAPLPLSHARPDGHARAPPRHRRRRGAAGPRPARLAHRPRLPPRSPCPSPRVASACWRTGPPPRSSAATSLPSRLPTPSPDRPKESTMFAQSYPSLEAFYAADFRRRHSRERDLGPALARSRQRRRSAPPGCREPARSTCSCTTASTAAAARSTSSTAASRCARSCARFAGYRDVCGHAGSLLWFLDRAEGARAFPAAA